MTPRITKRLKDHLRDPLLRNGYALICNTVITALLGMLYWMVAAQRYPARQVGIAAAAISSLMLISGVAQLNLGTALTRFLPRAGRSSKSLVLKTYGVTSLLSAVAGVIFFVLARGSSSSLLGAASPLVGVWFVAAVVTWSIFSLQDYVLAGLRQATWVAVENGLFGGAKILVLVLLASIAPKFGIFASWSIPVMVSLLPVNLLIFRFVLPKHVGKTREAPASFPQAELTRFIAWDYLGSLFLLGTKTLLPLLILAKLGARASGYFYVPWLIVTSLELITTNLGTSLTVEGALDESKLRTLTRSVLRRTATILIPISVTVLIFAPRILSLFSPQYALAGTTLLRLLALAILPRAVLSVFSSTCRVQRRMGRTAIAQGAMFFLVLLISTLLVGHLGLTGAGIAYLITQTLIALCVLPTLRRVVSDEYAPPASVATMPVPVAGLPLPEARSASDILG